MCMWVDLSFLINVFVIANFIYLAVCPRVGIFPLFFPSWINVHFITNIVGANLASGSFGCKLHLLDWR